MTHLALPLAAALAILVVVAAFSDIRTRRIPNSLALTGLFGGLVLQSALYGWTGLKVSLLGFGIGLLVFLPLFLLRGMGGGDVKLMAAIGAIAGPTNTFVIFILTAIFGGVLAVFLLLWKGGLSRVLRNCIYILGELLRLRPPYESRPELSLDHATSPKLPYAIPIALGSLLFLIL